MSRGARLLGFVAASVARAKRGLFVGVVGAALVTCHRERDDGRAPRQPAPSDAAGVSPLHDAVASDDGSAMSADECDALWNTALHKARRTVDYVVTKHTCESDRDCVLVEVGACIRVCKTAMPASALSEYTAAAKSRFGAECDAWERAGCARTSPRPPLPCPHLTPVCLREGTGLCVAEER